MRLALRVLELWSWKSHQNPGILVIHKAKPLLQVYNQVGWWRLWMVRMWLVYLSRASWNHLMMKSWTLWLHCPWIWRNLAPWRIRFFHYSRQVLRRSGWKHLRIWRRSKGRAANHCHLCGAALKGGQKRSPWASRWPHRDVWSQILWIEMQSQQEAETQYEATRHSTCSPLFSRAKKVNQRLPLTVNLPSQIPQSRFGQNARNGETVKQSYGQKGAGVTWRHMASGASHNASKVHGFDKDFRMNHYHDMTRSFSTRKPQLGQLPFSKAGFFSMFEPLWSFFSWVAVGGLRCLFLDLKYYKGI